MRAGALLLMYFAGYLHRGAGEDPRLFVAVWFLANTLYFLFNSDHLGRHG